MQKKHCPFFKPFELWSFYCCKPFDTVGSIEDLRIGGCWFESPARSILFLRIDDSHCDSIYSPLMAVHCFNDGYMGKQPVAWKEYWCGALVKRTEGKHG